MKLQHLIVIFCLFHIGLFSALNAHAEDESSSFHSRNQSRPKSEQSFWSYVFDPAAMMNDAKNGAIVGLILGGLGLLRAKPLKRASQHTTSSRNKPRRPTK